ncbi:hypothetical protein [Mycobacterium simiae]|uniref:hypothetical protein n=1 Tax=Mycobacterium simiae TaxID=1784 RepID=UPI0005C80A98|nr:hypothetical protein [Mycobacterium simiae]PLV44932.1 hypothetical protein X011_25585 [Mycobacterium tuberculosis variant microti OV254]BBX38912.1 hypothetical protein MSIM_03630 [Mycobacterium simiae]
MAYTFRNRFRLPDGDRLGTDTTEVELANSADDGLVVLKPERGKGFVVRTNLSSRADELILEGSYYVDVDAAAAAGRKWRQYLTIVFAREGRGVDFGPDDADRVIPTFDKIYENEPPGAFRAIGIEVGDRVIFDDYRLLVYKSDPLPKFIVSIPGIPVVNVSGWLETLKQRVNDARHRDYLPWNRQKAIAYRIVHLALTDSNPETRHIQLVTATEVLLEKRNRPQQILEAIDELLANVADWPDPGVKRRISEILENAKEESITRTGSLQVAALLESRYDGKSAKKFFQYVYEMRSGLVHRETPKRPRPTIDDVCKTYPELLKFVLDLLDAYQAS